VEPPVATAFSFQRALKRGTQASPPTGGPGAPPSKRKQVDGLWRRWRYNFSDFSKIRKSKVLYMVVFYSKYTRALTFENFCQDVVCRMQALHVSLGKVRSMDGPGSNANEEGLPANMWFEVVLSNGKKAAVRPAPCSDECLLGMDNEFQRLHVLGFVDMARISPKSST